MEFTRRLAFAAVNIPTDAAHQGAPAHARSHARTNRAREQEAQARAGQCTDGWRPWHVHHVTRIRVARVVRALRHSPAIGSGEVLDADDGVVQRLLARRIGTVACT